MASPSRITVGGPKSYDVVIGHGLLGSLAELVSASERTALIYPAGLRPTVQVLGESFPDAHLIEVPDGETQKTVEVAARCWDALGRAGFTRSDTVIGIGGGATTDLAGFVAATWLRGVAVVQVPTTLLAMVDAAVGGKTGVNTAAGKNLVGAFHPPQAVVVDLDLLETLPRKDYVAGLAEIIKVGFTHDPAILDLIDTDATSPQGPNTQELVERAIAVKAKVVAADLTEQGEREFLNYGHTLAHAIEKVEDFRWAHGEAVSVGLVYAAELSRLAAGLDDEIAERHRSVLDGVGLPTRYAGAWEQVHAAMAIDKKSRGARLRFVVLESLAGPKMLENPEPSLLAAAFEAVSRGQEAL